MYNAIVTRIQTRPLEGSDNIIQGLCCGYTVLVSKDTADGTLGIFFEAGGQLSEQFCKAHDLVRRKNEDGTSGGGYFEESRRVRAVKMRGVISEGFFCELDKLSFTGAKLASYKEGDQFCVANGIPICNKYFTLQTQRAMRDMAGSVAKRENKMFAKHIETEAFKRGIEFIPDSLLIITEKLHGTSHRVANVLEEVPIKRHKAAAWWAKLWKQPTTKMEWKIIHGSRNVVLDNDKPGYYGSNAFRYRAIGDIPLAKGEVVYGEIVGYTEGTSTIMNRHDLSGLKDKAAEKMFGKDIAYTYGCPEGCQKFFVYRITQVNEDGYAAELSYFDMVQRCKRLGITPVPLLDILLYEQGNEVELAKRVDVLVNGESGREVLASKLDSTHIREGVVVRYEGAASSGWLKAKSVYFGILEGYLKDTDYVDIEEAA